MGRAALCMRAAALLAAAGMFIFLAEGISADNDIAEAVTARVLKPTQAIAEVPEEYDELFEIQWGGGSLYHLKARLATMGCILNTIWVYDDNQWYGYNQYNIPHSFNQSFLTKFENNIPAGTLYGDCYNICDFDYYDYYGNGECLSYEETREIHQKNNNYPFLMRDSSVCDNNFATQVKSKVLPILPILPSTCVVKQKHSFIDSIGGAPVFDKVTYKPHIAISYNNERSHRTIKTEIHELCHINQMWYKIQNMKPYQFNSYVFSKWNESVESQKFIELVQFQKNEESQWRLPSDSIYKRIYSISPLELNAELCAFYLADKAGIYNFLSNTTTITKSNINQYLTPQIVEWLETYMVLPRPNVEDE